MQIWEKSDALSLLNGAQSFDLKGSFHKLRGHGTLKLTLVKHSMRISANSSSLA